MTDSDRILFDADRIDNTAREVHHFHDKFNLQSARVRDERERSVESFIGVAGDEFRTLCDRWLADAEEFTATLAGLVRWLDSANADYAAARSASRSMFPG